MHKFCEKSGYLEYNTLIGVVWKKFYFQKKEKGRKCVSYANLYKLPLERGYLSMLCWININCAIWTQLNGNRKAGLGFMQYVRGYFKISKCCCGVGGFKI